MLCPTRIIGGTIDDGIVVNDNAVFNVFIRKIEKGSLSFLNVNYFIRFSKLSPSSLFKMVSITAFVTEAISSICVFVEKSYSGTALVKPVCLP